MFSSLLLLVCCSTLVGSFSVKSVSNDKHIDGTRHTIKNTDITYSQHVFPDGQCGVELDGESKVFTEGEVLKVKHKWYKVEQCRLNRAYPVPCGSKLFHQLRDLACSLARQDNDESKSAVPRHINDDDEEVLYKFSPHLCCESACTIYEFVQHCPSSQWDRKI